MSWENLATFFAMGGYAIYVWPSYGLCIIIFVAEPILVHIRHKRAVEREKLFRLGRGHR